MFSNVLSQWLPEYAIIDAMFLLNTKPLRSTKSITDYSKFLFNRYAMYYYKIGIKEVHLVFDSPNKQAFNPKQFEQAKRDNKGKKNAHQHIAFTTETTPPTPRQDYIRCRECKRSIVEAIGLSLLNCARFWLQYENTLVLAGCFTGTSEDNAWIIQPADVTVPQPYPPYTTTAEEADQRVWRHATQCSSNKILIYSPDNDIYNIGLGCNNVSMHSKIYVIQLNVTYAIEESYLRLNNLLTACHNDPDLANLPQENIGQIMMMLFITTGCDFVSYFKTVGKAFFSILSSKIATLYMATYIV